MGTISGCRYLKVDLKAKIVIFVNSTILRCPNKIINIFLIEDYFHLPPVSTTPVVNLELRISPRIFEKIRNGILRGLGETDSWQKTRSRKSRGTVPLKRALNKLLYMYPLQKNCIRLDPFPMVSCPGGFIWDTLLKLHLYNKKLWNMVLLAWRKDITPPYRR